MIHFLFAFMGMIAGLIGLILEFNNDWQLSTALWSLSAFMYIMAYNLKTV